jgi:hypothetical protein
MGDSTALSMFNKREKNIAGVDPYTAKVFSNSSSPSSKKKIRKDVKTPLFKESLSTTISVSPNMARTLSDAHATLSRYSYFAEGTGQGDPRVSPYKTIDIRGTGDFTDGYWVITKVEHFVTWFGKYEMEFSCMTDGVGKNQDSSKRPEVAPSSPTRNVEFEMSLDEIAAPTKVKISAPSAMIKQTSGGFKVTPRRWESR